MYVPESITKEMATQRVINDSAERGVSRTVADGAMRMEMQASGNAPIDEPKGGIVGTTYTRYWRFGEPLGTAPLRPKR